MKISHETPLCLLKESLNFNDYQYVLPLFWNKYEEYKEFMLEYRKQKDSFVILDNGIFEGVIYSSNELIQIINELKPDIFVVEDAWNDAPKTLANAKHWMNVLKNQIPETTQLMAVLQGNILHELLTSYQTLVDLGYTHIAFNHSSNAYYNMFPNENKLTAQCLGRMELINELEGAEILVKSNYHHLLGCSRPIEFSFYKNKPFIKSGDTSAPIINGAIGIRLNSYIPYKKPVEKLEHFMEMDLSGQIEDIIFNVQKFKEYIN